MHSFLDNTTWWVSHTAAALKLGFPSVITICIRNNSSYITIVKGGILYWIPQPDECCTHCGCSKVVISQCNNICIRTYSSSIIKLKGGILYWIPTTWRVFHKLQLLTRSRGPQHRHSSTRNASTLDQLYDPQGQGRSLGVNQFLKMRL